MLRKLLSNCSGSTSSRTSGTMDLRYNVEYRIVDFYTFLSKGLTKLGGSVCVESPCFSLTCLRQAVEFVHEMHRYVLALIDDLWFPVQSKAGMNVLSMYMEVSRRLMDMCNCITDAMGQLESFQMSLEMALTSLESAVESLSGTASVSNAEKSLEACKSELTRMLSSKYPQNLWADFVSNVEQEQEQERVTKTTKSSRKETISIRRSVTFLPTTHAVDRKSLDISMVMVDVQVVAIFISSLILWVLTESSEQFKSPVMLDIGTPNGKVDWSASLLQLIKKVEHAQDTDHESTSHRVNRLQEFEEMRKRMNMLCEKIEKGMKSSEPIDVWMPDSSAMLKQASKQLAEIMKSSETLAKQSRSTFSDISSSRKMLSPSELSKSPTF